MAHGRPGALQFISNASSEGIAILEPRGLLARSNDTLIVMIGEKVFTESAAAIRVANRLQGRHRAAAIAWLIPKPLRDAGYRYVARNRHRWFPIAPSDDKPGR